MTETVPMRAWAQFDGLVASASPTNPWSHDARAGHRYSPDYDLLADLLAVPLQLRATTQSGLPAKAVDVWVAHELRRAGFAADEVWPRATDPRVLPREVALLRSLLPRALSDELFRRIESGLRGGVVSADANVLGKAYVKQVDVVMAQWARGPEIMVSTKRMDSSFGKNALNRIEESYGDSKNLRGRHPLAATGFMFVMRSTAFDDERDTALRLLDLLGKLAQEDDGYDATGVVVVEWTDLAGQAVEDDGNDPQDLALRLRPDLVPDGLQADRFLATIVDAVLDRTPIDHHVNARARKGQAVPSTPAEVSSDGVGPSETAP